MNSVKKSKVVVIGAGSVGESVAYALAIRGHASEIVIVDIAEDRAIGNALDINHGIAFRKSEQAFQEKQDRQDWILPKPISILQNPLPRASKNMQKTLSSWSSPILLT